MNLFRRIFTSSKKDDGSSQYLFRAKYFSDHKKEFPNGYYEFSATGWMTAVMKAEEKQYKSNHDGVKSIELVGITKYTPTITLFDNNQNN